jgi:hypothetical protein
MVLKPTQREIEQRSEVLIAAALCCLKGLDQVTEFGVKQRIDRRIRLGGDHLGPLEQVAINGPRKINSGCHRYILRDLLTHI